MELYTIITKGGIRILPSEHIPFAAIIETDKTFPVQAVHPTTTEDIIYLRSFIQPVKGGSDG